MSADCQDSGWCLLLQGEIPDEWGESGSFPILRNLSLSFNPLSGDLPEAWGSDGSSLQNLTHLNISNCGLNNTLPKDWARNLPSLTALNLSANTLSGDPQSTPCKIDYLLLSSSLADCPKNGAFGTLVWQLEGSVEICELQEPSITCCRDAAARMERLQPKCPCP